MEEIRIPLSRNKLYLLLAGSLLFLGIGIWFVTNPPGTNHVIRDPTIILIIGLIAILLSGVAAIVILGKLSGDKPGLVINSEGILDNSSGVSAGFISWKDITEIRTVNVIREKFLLIVVKNPEEYIHQQKGLVKRKAMDMNHRIYGSPISITVNTLAVNFDALHDLVQNAFLQKSV